jgi:hypothetical protein
MFAYVRILVEKGSVRRRHPGDFKVFQGFIFQTIPKGTPPNGRPGNLKHLFDRIGQLYECLAGTEVADYWRFTRISLRVMRGWALPGGSSTHPECGRVSMGSGRKESRNYERFLLHFVQGMLLFSKF